MDSIHRSNLMIEDLISEISNNELIDCGPRLDLACNCIDIVFEHGIAINKLFEIRSCLSASTLMRVQFESVVRSYWIMFIATNKQVGDLQFNWTLREQLKKDNYPTVSLMINALDKANLHVSTIIDEFKQFKKYHLMHLNSFIHSGKQAFVRKAGGFSDDFVNNLVKQCNNLILIAAQLIFSHTTSIKKIWLKNFVERYRDCFFLEADEDPKVKERVDSYLNSI